MSLGVLLAAAALAELAVAFGRRRRPMTRKQAVNHVRHRFGVGDARKFHVRSRMSRGERRIEIHGRARMTFWGKPRPADLHDMKRKGDVHRRHYEHSIATGDALVLASRRSWDHAARQPGRME